MGASLCHDECFYPPTGPQGGGCYTDVSTLGMLMVRGLTNLQLGRRGVDGWRWDCLFSI